MCVCSRSNFDVRGFREVEELACTCGSVVNFYLNVFVHVDIHVADTGRGLNMILGRERHDGDAVV